MNRRNTRALREALEAENAKWPLRMREVGKEAWPASAPPSLVRFWRSRRFMAQLYIENGMFRLSINRTQLRDSRWEGDIPWDDLQRIKSECGFDKQWAIEIYPPDYHVVDVANMRHLWLVNEAPDFAWRKS